MKKRHILAVKGCEFQMKMKSVKAVLIFLLLLAGMVTALSVSSDAISCLVKTLPEITLSVSIDMLSLVGFPSPTLLSLQPKINIKESITNVLSIILFIVLKYIDHFIALFFLI